MLTGAGYRDDRLNDATATGPRFTTFPPPALASYSARYAALITMPSVVPSVAESATPTLAVIESSWSFRPGVAAPLVLSQTRWPSRKYRAVDSRDRKSVV